MSTAQTIQLGTQKEREQAEMMQMLDMSADDLGTGRLPMIEPMEWKNVSVHIQSSIKILKEQQIT